MILKAGIGSPNGKIVFTAFSTARAIIYAADQGARVINLSCAGEYPSQILQQAVEYATTKECAIIAPAGDKNSKLPHFPAALKNVWAVTATDDDDNKLENSNYGYWIDIAAPGFAKINTLSSDTTQSKPSATAIGAAHVTGLAGLLLSCEDIGTSDSLKRRIIWSSENIYHNNTGFLGQLGAGRINALRAINSQHQPNIIIQKIASKSKSHAQYLFPVNIIPLTISIKNLSSAAQDINFKLSSNDPYLNILQSAFTLPYLGYQQEFSNTQNPFTIVLDDNYPPGHEAKLIVSLVTSSGFSLIQEFTYSNRIILPQDLILSNHSPVTLQWKSNPEFIGYNIYRKNNLQQSYLKISEVPVIDSTYLDSSTEPGYHYFYYITGIDSSGWESPSSNIITVKCEESQQFLFSPTQEISSSKLAIKSVFPESDTTLQPEDSLKFHIRYENSSENTFQVKWLVNEEIVEEKDSSFVLFANLLNKDTNLVKAIISCRDTSISFQWNVQVLQPIFDVEQIIFSPASDTTISIGDSILLTVNSAFENITCEWFINQKYDSLQNENYYLFNAPVDSSGAVDISVKIGFGDSAYVHYWHVNFESGPLLAEHISFFPTGDTTIYEGDSLNLIVRLPSQNDSLNNFQWQINGKIDTSVQQINYILTPDYFSTGVDTIVLKYELRDSVKYHQWLVTILNRNRSPEIVSHALPIDTTIGAEDTLLFSIFAFDPDQDSLSYNWFINEKLDTTATDSCYTFCGFEKQFESGTISVQVSDKDTSIFHNWIVRYVADLNQSPQVMSCSPPLDSTLNKADSLAFQIHCYDPDGDTLRFIWSINSWVDTSAHDSTYRYQNFDSTLTNDTLSVIIADSDTSLKLQWILWAENIELEPEVKSITWYPEQDSLVAEGDSLIFGVRDANDSCRFQWKFNNQVDSAANDSIFVYHLLKDSVAIDTIHVTVFDQDSSFSHEWRIHYIDLPADQFPLNITFIPEQDEIFAASDDSVKFVVRIIDGELANLNISWWINSQLDTTAADTTYCYNPQYLVTKPDTIRFIISHADTTISHKWIVQFHQQQMLPAPRLIFPIEGSHICEDDKLTWENDSSLVQIDSTGSWNYVVQLSSDSTFSEIISTDSCNQTSIALNDLSRFDHIAIDQPIYWRVKIFSGYDKISDFRKCFLPFYYYPQFAMLESFSGQKNENQSIDLFWTISYEKNCAGFNIYRSEYQHDNFIKINDQLITGGTEYSFEDIAAKAGKTYYYKLENISITGNKQFHNTIPVTAPKPDKFSLWQNYPNPFNTQTSIKYEIPIASHVKIVVSNVLGRKVKILVDKNTEAGFYTIYWDGIDDQGEHVVSGIYFYSMATIAGKITRKMIVVR